MSRLPVNKKPQAYKPTTVARRNFDGYDKNNSMKEALGSQRNKKILEMSEIRSTNFKLENGVVVEGWRLTRRGLEIFNSGTFPPGTITFTDIQNISSSVILGRTTAGSGSIEQLSASQVKTLLAIVASNISDFVEAAQDAVGTALQDTNSIDFTYSDGANTISAVLRIQNTTEINLSIDAGGLKAVTNGASGSFTTVDGKTVTVANGLITSIV